MATWARWWAPAAVAVVCLGLLGAQDQNSQSKTASAPASSNAAAPFPPGPKQPLPFSHKTHLTLGLTCLQCHASKGPNDTIALPTAPTCMLCHQTIAKGKPDIQKLAGFARDNRPIPWVRVYSVPGWVYWSHESHLKAGLQCADCHGDVAKMDVMHQVKNVTTMDGCTNCHTLHRVDTGCQSCHDESPT